MLKMHEKIHNVRILLFFTVIYNNNTNINDKFQFLTIITTAKKNN